MGDRLLCHGDGIIGVLLLWFDPYSIAFVHYELPVVEEEWFADFAHAGADRLVAFAWYGSGGDYWPVQGLVEELNDRGFPSELIETNWTIDLGYHDLIALANGYMIGPLTNISAVAREVLHQAARYDGIFIIQNAALPMPTAGCYQVYDNDIVVPPSTKKYVFDALGALVIPLSPGTLQIGSAPFSVVHVGRTGPLHRQFGFRTRDIDELVLWHESAPLTIEGPSPAALWDARFGRQPSIVVPTEHSTMFLRCKKVWSHGGAGTVRSIIACGAVSETYSYILDRTARRCGCESVDQV